MRPTALIALLYGFTVLLSRSATPDFPLQVSENRRHLVDQRGAPFLYHAEFTDKRRRPFEPPGDGDWVLVVDDAARKPLEFHKP